MEIDDLLRLIARAERLEALPRTGWFVCGVQHPESVASHSYMVALISLALSELATAQGLSVDRERLLLIALVHDLPEAITTDLPRPVKALLGEELCRDAERDAAAQILSHLPAGHEAYSLYHEGRCLEARLVKAADKIQMLAKALQYHHQRRGAVERFFAVATWRSDPELEFLTEVFDELRRRYEADDWFVGDFD